MKIIVAIVLHCLIIQSTFAEDCLRQLKTLADISELELLYGDMAPVLETTIKNVVIDYKLRTPSAKFEKRFIVAEIDVQKNPIVFGLTEKQVLEMDGDPNGAACSKAHIRNDYSNRWCHAYFVKLTYETAKKYGVPNILAGMLGASIFVVKEYAIDLHPTKADLVIADYTLFESKNKKEKISGTIFGDKMVFITYEKKF